jgi:hypothetical protein
MASSEPSALMHGLGEVSLRASAVAIIVPFAVVVAWYATGHRLDTSQPALHGEPATMGAIASFVLIPMFALTGASTALMVGFATFAGRVSPSRRHIVETLFVLAVGAWAVLAAVVYDAVVIPAIT